MNITCLRQKCGISQSRSVFFPQYGKGVFGVLLEREDQLHAQGYLSDYIKNQKIGTI